MTSVQLKTWVKKFFRYLGITIGVLLFFIFFIFVCLRLNFVENTIKNFAVTTINNIVSIYNLKVSVEDLELNLPFSIRVEKVKVMDNEGAFATLESLNINSRFLALLKYKVVIPSIDVKLLSLSRIPNITIPEQKEEKIVPEKTMQEQFDFIHNILFNSSLPSIYVSKIAISHATINPAVLHAFQKQEVSKDYIQISEENAHNLLINYFTKPIIIDGVWSAGLEKELLRFSGELTIQNEKKQAILKNNIDVLKTKALRFSLDFADEQGLSLAIVKEMLQMPQSKKAFIDFNLNAVGDLTVFEIKTKGKIFDEQFFAEPAKLKAFYSSKPFKGDIKLTAKPIIPNVINKGTFSFIAELDTHSITNEGKKIVQKDEQKEQNLSEKNQQDIQEIKQNEKKHDVPNKNVSFSYKMIFDDVEYAQENLQSFLGTKQEVKGLLTFQFFTRKLPRILVRDVEVIAKHFISKTNIDISREISVNSDFKIDDFSFLDTEKKTYKGSLSGKLVGSGKLENPKFIFNTMIPELTITTYKYKRDKRDNVNGKYIYLENLDLKLETKGFEKKENIIPLDKEALAKLYQKNPYAAPVKRMKELFQSAVNYPVNMLLSLNAKYMQEKLFANSKIRMTPNVIGLGKNEEKFIEFSDVDINILDCILDGKTRIDFAKTEEENLHISGKLQGNLENTKKLVELFAIPLELEKLKYSIQFSDKKTKKQDMELNVSAQSGKFQENVWNDFSTKIAVTDVWGNGAIDSQINFANIELADLGLVKNWKLTLKGLFQKMLLAMHFDGDANFALKAELGTNFEQLSAKLSQFEFHYPEKKTHIKLVKQAECFFAPYDINIKNFKVNVAPKGEVFLGGRVTQNMLDITGWIKNVNLDYLPKDFKGFVDGQFKVAGATTQPTGKLEVRLKDFKTLSSPKVSLIAKGKIIAVNNEHKLNIDVKMIDKEKYQVEDAYAYFQLPLKYKPMLSLSQVRPIKGKIVYKGSLKTIWGYVPLDGRKLTGTVDLFADISGSLSRPEIVLSANTEKAKFEDLLLGVLLTDLDFNLNLKKGHGEIALLAKDGRKGEFSLSGNFDVPFLYHGKYKPTFERFKEKARNLWYEKQLQRSMLVVDVQTIFNNFNPFYRNDFSATLSGEVMAKENIESLKVKGEINVDKAEVHLENIHTSSIPQLNIVEDSTKRIKRKRVGNNGNLDIKINILNDLGVYAPILQTLWKGNLQITGKIQEPSVKGALSAWKGKMNLVGSELNLNKGEITFDGSLPIVPHLNLVLEHKSAGVQSFIILKGLAFKPELEMTSNPYLPSDEVLAHILFSRSVSELSDFEKIRLAGVLTNLVGFDLNSGLTNVTKNFLGVDVLEINSQEGANGEEDINIEIGKYIRNNLYIGIEQGVGQQNTSGVLKYEVNENFSVGTKAGTEETEVGFKWKFDY